MGFVLTSIAYSAQTHNILTYTHDRWLLYFLTHAYEERKEPWPALPLSIIFGRNPSAAGLHKTALGFEKSHDPEEAARGQIKRLKEKMDKINELRKELPSLKDKLNKRLLPIEVIEGDLENDIITTEKDEIGKVLINDNYPYALIKVKNEKFDFDKTFNCGSAKVKIKKPDWLQIT